MIPFLFLMAGVCTAPSDELAEAIRLAYGANRNAIRQGRLQFEYRVGRARDLASARAGRFEESVIARGLWVLDGPSLRYDCLLEPEQLVANRQEVPGGLMRSKLPLASERLLSIGRVTLVDYLNVARDDRTVFHTSAIVAGTDAARSAMVVPFSLGVRRQQRYPLDEDLARALAREDGWSLKQVGDSVAFEGHEVIPVSIDAPDRSREYWVDLACGAVPRRARLITRGAAATSHAEAVFEDYRQVHDGWFPFRYTSFLEPGMAYQFVVTSAEFGSPPDRSEFRLEFPEPTPLTNNATLVELPPRKVWDLASIEATSVPGARPFTPAQPEPAPPVMAGERTGKRPWRSLTWAVVLGVTAVLTAWFLWRRGHG